MGSRGRVLLLALLFLSACSSSKITGDPFRIKTDNIPRAEIAGTILRAPSNPKGTVFMCHGFNRSKWDFRGYDWIATDQNWNVVRFDFRQHGDSSHSPFQKPTLGYYEIWDLKAVIDYADMHKLEKPYVCYGHSMGASTALRWAGQDNRIVGVLAQSPFRNALDATTKYQPDDIRVGIATRLFLTDGLRSMLAEVDIPKALASRDDLILWLTTGQRDFFPESDLQTILAASPSPQTYKKIVVIPNSTHGEHWKWPGNDPLIRSFLTTSRLQWADPTPLTGAN